MNSSTVKYRIMKEEGRGDLREHMRLQLIQLDLEDMKKEIQLSNW